MVPSDIDPEIWENQLPNSNITTVDGVTTIKQWGLIPKEEVTTIKQWGLIPKEEVMMSKNQDIRHFLPPVPFGFQREVKLDDRIDIHCYEWTTIDVSMPVGGTGPSVYFNTSVPNFYSPIGVV